MSGRVLSARAALLRRSHYARWVARVAGSWGDRRRWVRSRPHLWRRLAARWRRRTHTPAPGWVARQVTRAMGRWVGGTWPRSTAWAIARYAIAEVRHA